MYNEQQMKEYKKVAKLIQQINRVNPHAVNIAVYRIGKSIKGKEAYIECPFCGGSEGNSWKYHAIRPANKEYNYFIACFHCNKRVGLIKFTAQQYRTTYKTAVYTLARLLHIDTENIDISDVELPTIREIGEDTVVLQKKILPEVDLSSYGFSEKMHPTFYKMGLDDNDKAAFDIRYTGKECYNYMKDRICFPVRDIHGRIVGLIGKSVFNKEEYYEYKAKVLGISEWPNKEAQIKRIDSVHPYVETMYQEGFERNFTLFNSDKVFNDTDKTKLFICETPLETIRLSKTVLKQAVAMMQKELSMGQLYLLFDRYKKARTKIKIYLCYNEYIEEEKVKRNAKILYELGFTNIYSLLLSGNSMDSIYLAYMKAPIINNEYQKKKIWLNDLDNCIYELLEDEGQEPDEKGFLESLFDM